MDAKDKIYGQTPLHCACVGGHDEIVLFLITEHDADPNRFTFAAETPADVAYFFEHKGLASKLLKASKSLGV